MGLLENDWESERGMDDIQDVLDKESEEWVGRVPDLAFSRLVFGCSKL